MSDQSPRTDLVHSCCRVQGLANVSAQTCQNGQLVIVERLVAKGKLKGRFKCRVIGTQQVFALKQENIVKCENVPQVLYLAPVTADLLHSSKPGKSGPNASRDATTAAAGAVSEEPGLVTVDVSAVEQTCEAFSSTALCKSFVEIDEANVKRFAAELAMLVEKGGDPAAEIRRGATGACRRLPLQFDSPDIEINYWVTRNLLNFGSGHMDGGASNFGGARELADIVDRGCLTTFLTRSQKFDAEFMSRFGLHDVQQLFGIKVEEDVDIIGSAVKRSQLGGRRLALAQLIVRTLNATGERLRRLGCVDFAAVLKTAKDIALAAADPEPTSKPRSSVAPAIGSIARELMGRQKTLRDDPPSLIVAILAYCFDSFRDMSLYQLNMKKGQEEEEKSEQEGVVVVSELEAGGAAESAELEAGGAAESAREPRWSVKPLVFLKNAQAAVLDVARVFGDRQHDGWDKVECSSRMRFGSDAAVGAFLLQKQIIRPGPALEAAFATAKAKVGDVSPNSRELGTFVFKADTLATNAVRACSVVACARVAAEAGIKSSELQYFLEQRTTSLPDESTKAPDVDADVLGDPTSPSTRIDFAVQGTVYF